MLVPKRSDKIQTKAISKMLRRLPSRLSIRAGILRISLTSLARLWVESMDAIFVWVAPDDVHILPRFSQTGSSGYMLRQGAAGLRRGEAQAPQPDHWGARV